MLTADDFITALKMEPHVEGGYCCELFKSSGQSGERPLSSSIYYLLKAGQVSKFHRLKSDELWFYHYGAPLLIHQIDDTGNLSTKRLGLAVNQGEQPQILVSRNHIFGAELASQDGFCLVSCVVSPGFDYRDFELFSGAELLRLFPRHAAVIRRLNGG
jgi:predicted cupin superfamily sugar epimerase